MALPASLLLKRGVARRCPVCGSRGLFQHWVRMRPTCPGCGLRFRRTPGQWLGSWFLNICLAQAVVVALLVAEVGLTWPEGPSLAALVLVAAAAVAVPVAFFPYSRTIWTAIDLAMRPLELDDGVAPGVELEQLARLPARRPPRRRPPAGGPARRTSAGTDGRRPPSSGTPPGPERGAPGSTTG